MSSEKDTQPRIQYLTVDTETTMKCPVGSNKANPYWPENHVVMTGASLEKYGVVYKTQIGMGGKVLAAPVIPTVMCGHHIAFDIAYFRTPKANAPEENLKTVPEYFHHPNLRIWDTQLAEYILTGQQHKYASLDELAVKYGLPLKDDVVKSMFAAGKGADEIPPDILADYLEQDVKNTEAIAFAQMKDAEKKNMLPLIMSQMDALLATIEMTHNGLYVDRKFLEDGASALATSVDCAWRAAQRIALTEYGDNYTDFKSPTQLARFLFGGTRKEKVIVNVGTYKNGKPKTKVVYNDVPVLGHVPAMLYIGADCRTPSGGFSSNDAVLSAVSKALPAQCRQLKTLIDLIVEAREGSKQLSTYFDGIKALIMPDGCVHHTLNHCATTTGRLSSTEPNMQNIPKDSTGSIKNAFVSRWGNDGVILEADYKQLEIVALACITNDPTLISDISSGKDIHTELYRSMFGRTPTEKERWSFKRCSFALIYGGGVNAIMTQGGLSDKAEAKKFMNVFYSRYPQVKSWHDSMEKAAVINREYLGDKDTETGLPLGVFKYRTVTGRTYVFKEYPNSPDVVKWKGVATSFSPTELKNYPVQGFATADIVPLVLGKLYRVLKNTPGLNSGCLLINTVHDSVLFDVHKDVLNLAGVAIKQVMESAHIYMKETFNVELPLQFKAELSYGPSWGQQTEKFE